MSVRVPSFSSQGMISKNSDEILSALVSHGVQYEQGFLNNVIEYIKQDPVLKNYYIRMVYECEVVRIVIEKKQSGEVPSWLTSKLKHELDCMRNANNPERMSVYDSEFHNFIFFVAGEEGFFNWYNANSKSLQDFLDCFWVNNFDKPKNRDKMIKIHEVILEAIETNDEEKGIKAMQEHFSNVILILLSSLYQS